jgi:hypothetical protein
MSEITTKISINKFLHDTQGGNWTFDGKSSWGCDDGNRAVSLTDKKEYWLIYNDHTKMPERIL